MSDILKKSTYAKIPLADDFEDIHFVSWRDKRGTQFIETTTANRITCPLCDGKNLGRLLDYRFKGVGVFCIDCLLNEERECKLIPKPQTDTVIPGLPRGLDGVSFVDLDGKSQSYINAVQGYANKPAGYLLLAGTPGVGKSFTVASIMRHCAKKYDTRYIEAMELYQNWLEKPNSYMHLLHKMQEVSLLVIDDFGHKVSSESYNEFLHMLFSKRKSEDKATIIVTNMQSDELMKTTKPAIFSRITSGIILKLEGADRRKKSF